MAEDQRDTIAFLSDPASYGPGVADVERHETHISLVFLAGDHAFKLKRAVKYPYLDFSTAEQRRRACEAELRLNRRTAPELYREVRSIVRRPDGALAWGGEGDIVDWVVAMRRFDQEQLLDAVARSGGLQPQLLYALAAHIADFHANAERRLDRGGAKAMRTIIEENDACLRAGSVGLPDRQIGELHDASVDWLQRVGDLLDRRRQQGKVRRCHGDLHLRNICVVESRPVLFDCLEFSEEFASIDVLYDLAFLLMDLEHRGDAAGANLVLNRYLDLTVEDDGLAAMPLFVSLRAAIRAHVAASTGAEAGVEARHYLDEACAALRPPPARLIAIGGLSGTGKSTIAAALATEFGARPGARVLRSDVIRKRLFGLDPESRLPANAYEPDVTERVYAALREGAVTALQAGYCAIIDAVALKEEERRSFAEIARRARVQFTGLWLEAPLDALLARVDARKHDASDATQEIVKRQLQINPGPLDWQRLDAGDDVTRTLAAARQALA
ncbi:MAG TPA: AAA family ATPase [Stellaceae bacterium]|nr:AAA family ATPase [Stellaceae bacterium]